MKYVAVLGDAKINQSTQNVFKYFRNYLASMGEPTTSRAWTLFQLNKHFKKLIKGSKEVKRNYGEDIKLFFDSGGFQIIVGYINKLRVNEYMDSYHFLLKKFRNDIDYIFSLDIANKSWNTETTIKFNDICMEKSIKLIKQYPEIKDKQIFVVQSRVTPVFQMWKDLMEKHNIYNYYERYSFGGLVGLKKETNAKFNHFVPFTMWLIAKIRQKRTSIKHIHMLGQSSKLALVTGVILEKIIKDKYNLNVDITMDSSELVRFTRIENKLPILIRDKNNKFLYLKNIEDLEHAVINIPNLTEKEKKELIEGKVSNDTFIDLLSQNIRSIIDLSHALFDNLNVQDILNFKLEDIKELHEIFEKGRVAVELKNNLDIINELIKYVDNNDINSIEDKCFDILKTY